MQVGQASFCVVLGPSSAWSVQHESLTSYMIAQGFEEGEVEAASEHHDHHILLIQASHKTSLDATSPLRKRGWQGI